MLRSRGFLDAAVREVHRLPGQTAKGIVERLLADGRATSMAANRVGSLSATLAKHWREKGLRRERLGRHYRYYPAASSSLPQPVEPPPASNSSSHNDYAIRVSDDCKAVMEGLVLMGKFKDSSEAAEWLIRKGMEAAQVT